MKDILNKEAGRKSLENAKQGKLMVVGRKTVDRGHIDRILIDNRQVTGNRQMFIIEMLIHKCQTGDRQFIGTHMVDIKKINLKVNFNFIITIIAQSLTHCFYDEFTKWSSLKSVPNLALRSFWTARRFKPRYLNIFDFTKLISFKRF